MSLIDIGYTPGTVYKCPDCNIIWYGLKKPKCCPRCKDRHSLATEDHRLLMVAETVTGRTCLNCGENIDHLRPQAVTCSSKCRKAVSRKQKAG